MIWLLACTGEPTPTCSDPAEPDTVDVGALTSTADIPYADGTVRAQARWPQLGTGLPVAVVLHGAWDVAGTPVTSSSLRPSIDTGLATVHIDFPGNAATTGPNDHRGQGSRLAVEAALRWAAGALTDTDGCSLADRAPVATDDLYVVGTSNGGNIAVATLTDPGLALPDIAGLVVWETPAGPQFSNVELGISPTVYEAGACTYTPASGITCAIPEETVLAGEDTLCFDASGDSVCGPGDVSIFGTQDVQSGITYVSPALAAAAEARGVLPTGWSTAAQATDWWAWRDAGRLAADLIALRPSLPVLIVASEEDHVQRLSDHPHVYGLGEALQTSGAGWTRLNPGAEWLPENTTANEPNAPLTLADPSATLLDEDAERPMGDTLAAAIHELSDRRASGEW